MQLRRPMHFLSLQNHNCLTAAHGSMLHQVADAAAGG